MKKNIFGKIIYIVTLSVLMLSLSGCALIPELSLTQEQNELIAEYAAGLLVKYQLGHSMGMVPVSASDLIDEDEAEVAIEEMVAEEEPDVEDVSEEVTEIDSVSDAVEMVVSTTPIGEVLGALPLDVSYDRFEATDKYPEDGSEDLFFSMQAADGNELLILHFLIRNNSDEDSECDLMSNGVKSRLIVNDGERIPAQATILEDDIFNYSGIIEGNGFADAVMVFEVPRGTAENVSSLKLVLSNSDGENVYNLQ